MTSANSLPLIGILGDGQLSAMMTEAYQAIGGRVAVLGQDKDGWAHRLADISVIGDYKDQRTITDFLAKVEVCTLENEFIDSQALIDSSARSGVQIYPQPERYSKIEDKLSEKRFFESLDVPIPEFIEIASESDLPDVPGYLKLAKGGYDGIGTYRVDTREEALECYSKIKDAGVVLFEHTIDFKKELSLIAAKGREDLVFYPLVETFQVSGTCRYVAYPAGVSADVQAQAEELVGRIMKGLDCRGLFAFELFLSNDDQLLLNESAPRPHNSGHITLDSVDCSQFENHMRAVAGLSLVSPSVTKESALMLNLLARKAGPVDENELLSRIDDPQLAVKLYGKRVARVKRKMGHINLWGDKLWQRAENLADVLEM